MENTGRWYAEGNQIFQEIGGKRVQVACVEMSNEEAAQLALLIAAAPELLTSLKNLMKCKRVEFANHFPQVYAKSRDAVKKATGNFEW